MSIHAVIVDPEAPNAMRIADVAEPAAGPTKALIEVHHVSLNRGDLNDARSGRIPPGEVLGSDAAGVVAEAARDGSGPPVGSRVVALAHGAFAERIAVEVDSVAEVPGTVDLAQAAALPVAGLAAEVIVGLDGVDQPVDVVLESVGGQQLVAAWELLAPGGSLQNIGWSSGEPAVFPPYSTIGPPKAISSFVN